jgi:hypothetical protein
MEFLQSFALWLESTKLSDAMIYPWVWPTVEVFHFVGLTLLLGTIIPLDLRMLGMAKQLPLGPLHQLVLPWAFAGFGISLTTGTLLVVGMATAYVGNMAFYLKLLAILLGGVNALVFYLTVSREVESLGPGDDAPPLAKVIAGSSLFLWLSVITFGRSIALY